jgi:hypothetical protein
MALCRGVSRLLLQKAALRFSEDATPLRGGVSRLLLQKAALRFSQDATPLRGGTSRWWLQPDAVRQTEDATPLRGGVSRWLLQKDALRLSEDATPVRGGSLKYNRSRMPSPHNSDVYSGLSTSRTSLRILLSCLFSLANVSETFVPALSATHRGTLTSRCWSVRRARVNSLLW